MPVVNNLGGSLLLLQLTLPQMLPAVALTSSGTHGALTLPTTFSTDTLAPLLARTPVGRGSTCGISIPWVARQNVVNVHAVALRQVSGKLCNLLADPSRYASLYELNYVVVITRSHSCGHMPPNPYSQRNL
jgi:hypothetical protein